MNWPVAVAGLLAGGVAILVAALLPGRTRITPDPQPTPCPEGDQP